MKLTFLGANRQVTGSRYCLEVGRERVMIDCGLTQERDFLGRNWEPCPIPADTVDALLLTHIHIDHSGLIPKFVREGFRARVYATRPTVDLADVVLHDSARIQEEDAAYKKKRHRREGRVGKHPEVPLYTTRDVEKALRAFHGVDYDNSIRIGEGIKVVFRDAGHILGSAMLEIHVKENDHLRRIVFSGDIGQWGKPLIKDPTLFDEADYVVMESTYGNREHETAVDAETELCEIINETLQRGGNVIIPTFAIERAQELMYYIGRFVYGDRIPDVPIFLDSPMALDVTEVFRRHRECLDAATSQLILSDEPPLRYPGLRLVRTADESKAINNVRTPSIIMSPAGMCNAGRIKHHLRNNISRPECTVLFVGYQANGTLGRHIVEGNSEVRIHGRMWPVRARIEQINGFSSHADQAGLMRWLSHLKSEPRRVFLTHGEEDAAMTLAGLIDTRLGWPVSVPAYLDSATLD